MSFTQIILTPFAWLLSTFNSVTGSYALALLLFALVIKLVLFPLSLKGKRSMIQMNMLSAEMQKLQKKYGRDRERYNIEVQKLYAREKVSPMGGCLWSLLPLIILLPLYAVVRRPLFYTMGLSVEQIAQIAEQLSWSTAAVDMGWIKEAAAFTSGGYNELFLASMINESNVGLLQGIAPNLSAINFNFLGVNLARVPQLKFWLTSGGFGLFLMPVISAVSGLFFSFVSQKTNAINKQAQQGAGASKAMMFFSPIISLWIGFSMPAAMCVYWLYNNLFSLVQELICGRILKKDYERAAAAKAEAERLAKEEEKEEKRRKAEERARRIEEEKLNKGKKKKVEKKPEEAEPGVNKDASRVGMRQYARGRAYNPDRYDESAPAAPAAVEAAPAEAEQTTEKSE